VTLRDPVGLLIELAFGILLLAFVAALGWFLVLVWPGL